MLIPTIKVQNGVETTGSYLAEFNEALYSNANMTSCRIYKNGTLIYDNNNLMSLNIWYKGALLTSVMKNATIEVWGLVAMQGETLDDIQVGVSNDMGVTFYYVSLGKFIVSENEQNLERKTTTLTCYDELVKSMEKYSTLGDITYGENYTNYNYLSDLCNLLGYTVGSSIPQSGVMARLRNAETYNSEYTYRDILDDFAEILGGCLIVKNGALEYLYPNSTITMTDEQLKTFTIKDKFDEVLSLVLSRSPQDDNLSYSGETSSLVFRVWKDGTEQILPENGSVPVTTPMVASIEYTNDEDGETIRLDNNMLVEGYQVDGVADRSPYLQDIYNKVHGWGTFNTFELTSFGYILFEPADKLMVSIENNGARITVPIMWTTTSFTISPAIVENAETELPVNSEGDYTQSSKTAQADRAAYLYVDKVNGVITSQVSSIQTGLNNDMDIIRSQISNVEQTATSITMTVSDVQENLSDSQEDITTLQTALSVQADGVHISQGREGSYTLITDEGMDIYAQGNRAAYARVDGFYATDYIQNGWHMQTANGNNSFNFIRKEYDNE